MIGRLGCSVAGGISGERAVCARLPALASAAVSQAIRHLRWSASWHGLAAPSWVLPAPSGCRPAKRCADLRRRRSSMSESRQVIGRTRRSSCTDRGCDETPLCGRWTRAGVRHRPANSTPFLRSAPGQECPGWRTCAGPVSGPVIRDARTQTDLRTALSPYAVPLARRRTGSPPSHTG